MVNLLQPLYWYPCFSLSQLIYLILLNCMYLCRSPQIFRAIEHSMNNVFLWHLFPSCSFLSPKSPPSNLHWPPANPHLTHLFVLVWGSNSHFIKTYKSSRKRVCAPSHCSPNTPSMGVVCSWCSNICWMSDQIIVIKVYTVAMSIYYKQWQYLTKEPPLKWIK